MSDDILSGGAIDPSTSGPIPPSRDDRDRDILLQQKERQDQDAIGGTQFPPKPQPLPPIPEAVEVAPPLPVIPSFDFNIAGSALEETREIARQTVVDVLKNVTINGQGPSFEGSAIAFSISQQPPASEAFIFQGVMVAQPLPPSQTIQAAAPPQQQPTEEIQSVVVSPPSVGPTMGATQESTTQESTFPEPAKPSTEILESDVIPPPTDPSLDETRPVKPQTVKPPTSKEVEPPSKPEEDEDFAPRYTRLSDYPTLEAGAQDESQKARDEARDRGAKIGNDKAEGIRNEVRNRGADIGFDRAEEIRQEAGNRGAKISFDDAEKEREEAREDGAVARGFKEAEARRRERMESDADFDRESPIRQKRETTKEFKERQEELRQERAERVKGEESFKRAREGDISEIPSGMIPVKLTRADGKKKILAFMATEFVGVVEGTTSGERPATLPSEDSYYEGGGGGSCFGLALYTKTVGTPPNTTTQVWVSAGTVAGQLPSGFDAADGKNIANSGSGDIWAEVNIDQSTGEITSVAVSGGGDTPTSATTTSYYTLGHYEYEGTTPTVTNYGCGSIDASICRNWFAIDPPFYGLTLTRN